MQLPRTIALSGIAAMALALTHCADTSRKVYVVGDYKPVSACLHAELARDQPGVLVGYAVDEAAQQARIWHDSDNHSFQGRDGGFDAYDIYLAQSAAHEVTIRERDRSLYFGASDFKLRLLPMIRRCAVDIRDAGAS
jgi:hypothetical protein